MKLRIPVPAGETLPNPPVECVWGPRRIETALGVARLQQDPTKHAKEDFMSPKTLILIKDAAKVREDLTGAMEARKTVTSDRPSLFQSRLRKSSEADSATSPQRHVDRTGAPGSRAPAR
jgi:hypothetical protein